MPFLRPKLLQQEELPFLAFGTGKGKILGREILRERRRKRKKRSGNMPPSNRKLNHHRDFPVEVRIGHQTNPDDDELNRDVQWALWDAPWRRHRDRNEDRDRSPPGINALSLATVEHEPRITVAFDTGAAVTTIPESLAEKIRDDGNNQK